ncbi:unnamed protein product [Rotaria sp. Silwood1]|nr:unnamed protein product [Rotaria sp. Silwood1]
MLMKFGDIKSAENIFYSIKNKDNFTFGAMMKGYVENDQYEKVLDLYEEMNIKPDDIIYIIVLNACAGLSNYRAMNIEKQILQKICNKWQNNKIILTSGIDMLMTFGNVNDAEYLFRSIQKKDIIAYGAMMNGYNMNNQPLKCFELFEELKQNLVPDEIIFNILIGTCAQIGLLSRCKFIFNQIPLHMQHQQRIQNALINMWQFKAHDRSHPRSSEIYAELDRLSSELIQYGHRFDSSWITRSIQEDESIESVLCGHSEKLAIAFNFIQRPIPSIIQITKNLRVCGDCHAATKLIAKIRQRDIIVRDANRIHHFYSSGQCSCQDHF